jgi:hypothetical protein
VLKPGRGILNLELARAVYYHSIPFSKLKGVNRKAME